jgi:hypothetical protein
LDHPGRLMPRAPRECDWRMAAFVQYNSHNDQNLRGILLVWMKYFGVVPKSMRPLCTVPSELIRTSCLGLRQYKSIEVSFLDLNLSLA